MRHRHAGLEMQGIGRRLVPALGIRSAEARDPRLILTCSPGAIVHARRRVAGAHVQALIQR
ncbi:hypothetical protein LK12_22295 [Novosphingobium malaysiense]|uniref:Uncharacterized protein n=1 Tax=Novosphingobium malaysiense TaxID=1348853 RepID=A0A0B1ZIH1_9SPHN|nr:hypothetical protein LK12_22295 [Novosphingobium malaysiense]